MSEWLPGKVVKTLSRSEAGRDFKASIYQTDAGVVTVDVRDYNCYRILDCPMQIAMLAIEKAPRPNDLTDGATLRFAGPRIESDMKPALVVEVVDVNGALVGHPSVTLGGFYRLSDIGSGKRIEPRPLPDFTLVALREDEIWSPEVIEVVGGSQGVYLVDRTLANGVVDDEEAYELHFLYNVADETIAPGTEIPGYGDHDTFALDNAMMPSSFEPKARIDALPEDHFADAGPSEASFLEQYRFTGDRHAEMIHERLVRDLVETHSKSRAFEGAPRPAGGMKP